MKIATMALTKQKNFTNTIRTAWKSIPAELIKTTELRKVKIKGFLKTRLNVYACLTCGS